MSRTKKILLFLLFAIVIFLFWFIQRVVYQSPDVPACTVSKSDLVKISETHFVLGNSWLRMNGSGNWECYIEGNGYQRGRTLGILQEQLGHRQEEVFVAQLQEHVPSWWMQKFLTLGIAWFNRDLDQQIPLEYRQEIYGISQYFSDDFNSLGPKYNRIINYHAAHDIGHAVQNMHLVGCTAFGTWQNDSTGQSMLMGRNFDFYFGDQFAENKIVLLSNPESGYRFISVTWPSFIGVVSGLNEKGLGITLNSDKSEIPVKSGTPVSIIARDVLQYAATIEEAIVICNKYKSFVSESFTISSAIDHRVVVIEKTPDTTGIYRPVTDTIIVTNHFQSPELKDIALNIEHMQTSESVRRYARTSELIKQSENFDVQSVAEILRDQKGLGGSDIGYGNPLAVNQLLAHHAVIFENIQKLIWVSSYPFQENNLDAYSLSDFPKWTTGKVQFPITIDSLRIAPDNFYTSPGFARFARFKELKTMVKKATGEKDILENSLIEEFIYTNPEYYETYRLLGNYYFENNQDNLALDMYQMALTKEIAYGEDRDFIELRIAEIEEHD